MSLNCEMAKDKRRQLILSLTFTTSRAVIVAAMTLNGSLSGALHHHTKIAVTVEVCCKQECNVDLSLVKTAVLNWLGSLTTVRYTEGPLAWPPGQAPLLDSAVESIVIVDLSDKARPNSQLLAWEVAWEVHVYQLDADGPAEDDEGEDNTPSYREWVLPSQEFHGQWEALYYDSEIKQRLLRFARSALLFADARVSPHLVSWNRVVLLHGPPGTGKTSLCKALAQKLTIRLSDRYMQGQLIEVNAHSLFSKWFSESGKLVSRLFAKIQEAVEEQDCLVFVLIDEVESLTAARKAAVSGSEPADAIRAVNALLTQLDQLKAHPNVMVLTTSNITEAIDLAFVDRADIKAYIGPPTLHARYEILRSCLHELSRTGIITDPDFSLLPFQEAQAQQAEAAAGSTAQQLQQQQQQQRGVAGQGQAVSMEAEGSGASMQQQHTNHLSRRLLEVCVAAEGLSGRALRKLPFLAHAHGDLPGGRCMGLTFVGALMGAVRREREDRGLLHGEAGS